MTRDPLIDAIAAMLRDLAALVAVMLFAAGNLILAVALAGTLI